MQMPNYFGYLSIFVHASENLVMADDVTTPSNLPIALVEQKELEETPFDMNVSQWPCKEELSRKMMRIRVNHLAWDYQLFPNPHALAIYLKFVPTRGATLEGFEECQCEDDDIINFTLTLFIFIVKFGFLMMAIIVGYKVQSTPFPWSIEDNNSLAPFVAF
jgi:hypothetical protein